MEIELENEKKMKEIYEKEMKEIKEKNQKFKQFMKNALSKQMKQKKNE